MLQKNKKGGFLDAMNMVLMIPTFILIMFGIGILLYGILNTGIDTKEFNNYYINTYTSQYLNTPNCFAYEDTETKRVDYGVIDEKKLTHERFILCAQYGEPTQTLPIQLEIIHLETNKKETYTTPTWNEGLGGQKTLGEEVIIITSDLQQERALFKFTYANPRMNTP